MPPRGVASPAADGAFAAERLGKSATGINLPWIVPSLRPVVRRRNVELGWTSKMRRKTVSRKNDVHRNPACEFEIQSDHRHLPAMSLAFDREDFSFVVKMRGAPAKPWVWEIHRAGKSGPVERSPVCYASMAEAVREGKKALARLLMAA